MDLRDSLKRKKRQGATRPGAACAADASGPVVVTVTLGGAASPASVDLPGADLRHKIKKRSRPDDTTVAASHPDAHHQPHTPARPGAQHRSTAVRVRESTSAPAQPSVGAASATVDLPSADPRQKFRKENDPHHAKAAPGSQQQEQRRVNASARSESQLKSTVTVTPGSGSRRSPPAQPSGGDASQEDAEKSKLAAYRRRLYERKSGSAQETEPDAQSHGEASDRLPHASAERARAGQRDDMSAKGGDRAVDRRPDSLGMESGGRSGPQRSTLESQDAAARSRRSPGGRRSKTPERRDSAREVDGHFRRPELSVRRPDDRPASRHDSRRRSRSHSPPGIPVRRPDDRPAPQYHARRRSRSRSPPAAALHARRPTDRPASHYDARRRSRSRSRSPLGAGSHRPFMPHSNRDEDRMRNERERRSAHAQSTRSPRRNAGPGWERTVRDEDGGRGIHDVRDGQHVRVKEGEKDFDTWFGNARDRYGGDARDARPVGPREHASERHGRRMSPPQDRRGPSPSSDRREGVGRQEMPVGETDRGGRPRGDDVARADIDIGVELARCADTGRLLALFQAQQLRVSLPHVLSALDKMAELLSQNRRARSGDVAFDELDERLLDLLADTAMRFEADFDSKVCVDAMHPLKKLKSKSAARSRLMQALCNRLLSSISTCDTDGVVVLLSSLSDMKSSERPDSFQEAICVQIINVAPMCNVPQVSGILYSLAKLGIRGQPHVMRTLSARVTQLIDDHDRTAADPAALSNIFWAFATLQERPETSVSRALLAQLKDCGIDSSTAIKPHHVSNVLWSLALLDITSDLSIFDFLAQQTKRGLWKSYTPEFISNSMFAHAKLQGRVPVDSGLVQVLTRRALETMRSFSSGQLGNLFWALAILRNDVQADPRLLDVMCERAMEFEVDSLQKEQVSGIMWSISELHKHETVPFLPSILPPAVDHLMLQLACGLPKFAGSASPRFLVQTLHSMATVSIWNFGHVEDDTTYVRRVHRESAVLHRDVRRVDRARLEIFGVYAARALEVVHAFEALELETMLWSLRALSFDVGADLLAAFSQRMACIGYLHLNVVDVLWTHAFLWVMPEQALLVDLEKHAEAWSAAEDLELVSVTRLLWSLGVICMQHEDAGGVKFRGVLDRLARELLLREDELEAENLKHLHQFFLTCNTCVPLVDCLSESVRHMHISSRPLSRYTY